ncbi:MAG: hypothetical protein J5I92_11425 [Thiogranum sp.]|nr:hypothetical protein [Thiogranum sp.]
MKPVNDYDKQVGANHINGTLEDRFKAFLGERDASESLDAPSFDALLANGKRADFLLDDRRIVLELKFLQANPEYKVEERLGPHRDRPDFPVFYWDADLNEVLRHLPDGEDIRREISNAVTRSIQGALEKADDQIRATKTALNIPDACGVAVILNERIGMLAPDLVTAKSSEILLKRKEGQIRYRDIAYVWIISESHRLSCDEDSGNASTILLAGPMADAHASAGDYLSSLMEQWAQFLGVRFVSLGEHENFDKLTFEERPVEPPKTTENLFLPRHEIWRQAYRNHPYLRSLSEADFLQHTARVFATMTPHFIKGGRKLSDSAIADLMEGWTHALEEAKHRRVDMRKLQPYLRDLNV